MSSASLFDKLNELCAGDMLDPGELYPDDTDTPNESQAEMYDLSYTSMENLSKSTDVVKQEGKNSQQADPSAPAPAQGVEVEISCDQTAPAPRITRSRSSREGLRSAPATSSPKPKRGAATRGRGGRGRKKSATATTKNSAQVVDTIDLLTNPLPPVTGWRNRNAAAEIAARAHVVDSIDLIASPLPPITGVISVDSDGSDVENTTNEESILLDASFDAENPELSVKVKWNGEVERFSVRRYQKLAHVYKSLAERGKVPMEQVVLTLLDRILTPDDTPASIDYKIFNFIEGRIMVRNWVELPSTGAKLKKKKDPNKITLKIQSDKWKRPIDMEISKTDRLKILYIKCGEELNVPHAKLKLSFDGDVLDLNARPSDFEFEGGEIIDLVIKE